jgi:hypothetical protein
LAGNSVERIEQCLHLIEGQLEIQHRWTSTTPEYIAIVQNMTVRDYRKALDHLERLVVQRLFELAKLNMSRTGILSLLICWYDLNSRYS